MLAALLGVMGCSESGVLEALPASLAWGEINFQEERPETGYSPRTISLTNTGETTLEVSLQEADFEHLCLVGLSAAPVVLSTLQPGQGYIVTAGVCGYRADLGERDSTVEGALVFSAEAVSVEVPWSFTPTEQLDTGR